MSTFEKELQELINKHSQENPSGTPDFILSNYVLDCLETFKNATSARDQWYGFKSMAIGSGVIQGPVPEPCAPWKPKVGEEVRHNSGAIVEVRAISMCGNHVMIYQPNERRMLAVDVRTISSIPELA